MVQQRLRDSGYSISVHNQNKHNYKTKVRRVECKQTKNQIKKDITKTGKELDFCSTYDIGEYSKIKIASDLENWIKKTTSYINFISSTYDRFRGIQIHQSYLVNFF